LFAGGIIARNDAKKSTKKQNRKQSEAEKKRRQNQERFREQLLSKFGAKVLEGSTGIGENFQSSFCAYRTLCPEDTNSRGL
tara:strand:+ start:271 stop:513 length:243 start_codon:yes stop_codon:yes gene_type:complete